MAGAAQHRPDSTPCAIEWLNRHPASRRFPFLLFGALWIISTAFFFRLIPAANIFRNAQARRENAVLIGIEITALAMLGLIRIAIVEDQLPCFLGFLNCN